MVDEYRARPAARGAAVGPPERRSKDCRRRETPSKAPLRVETCEIRNQSAPEVAQGYEALVGPAQARDDGRRARADAETASVGSPELTRCLEQAILTPVLNFDQSGTSFGRKLSIFDASERSDRVGRRPHKSIYALRTLSSAHAVIWHGPWACWAEFEAGVTPLASRLKRSSSIL